MYDIVVKIITEGWQVLGQMAPYLLLGFLVAGVLSVAISPAWVERHLGGRGMGPVFKASLFGVPLPLCSCGVIPVAASMYRHGASRAATTSFLLSTPQTGVDSIAVTYALLGPVFAIFRPIAALITGLVGGGLVQWFGGPSEANATNESQPTSCTDACCTGPQGHRTFVRVLNYGFVILPRDIGLALLVGVFLAGAMAALVPQDSLNAYLGGGLLSILLLMAAGVPVYVCATASVPLAAGFMHMGASPGAALAFLIAGPATNAATFTTIWKVLGQRAAILYLTTVAASAVVCGLLLDWLVPTAHAMLPTLGNHIHAAAEGAWFYNAGAVVLLAVLAFSYWATGGHKSAAAEVDVSSPDQRVELLVSGMTCSHCAESVRRALASCIGVESVDVDLQTGRAAAAGVNLDRQQLAAAVTELGYAVDVRNDMEACGAP
ncbi:MAG: SO_0444 family Cu/Zn efflux transporter [Planctomycetes bacterium]|nr:SO_0444 family Cu/Zn efflux transporter [Planctomycetota bacterium]